jgi:hypothetical protein
MRILHEENILHFFLHHYFELPAFGWDPDQYLSGIYFAGVMVEMEAIVEADKKPVSISVILPAEADSVFLVKGIPSPNSEVLPLMIKDGAPFKSVDFEIAEPQFRLFAFYYPFAEGHDRNLQWPVGANVDMKNVHMAVQVPIMAEKFNLTVDVESEEKDQQGISFKIIHLGDIQAHGIETVAVSYLNFTGLTTMENLRTQLEQPQNEVQPQIVEQEKPKRHTLLLWEPLVILGVLFSVISVLYYQNQHNEKRPLESLCPSCEKPVKSNDKFCTNCGEKIQ